MLQRDVREPLRVGHWILDLGAFAVMMVMMVVVGAVVAVGAEVDVVTAVYSTQNEDLVDADE